MDHLAGVLGGILEEMCELIPGFCLGFPNNIVNTNVHGVSSGRDLAGVALSQSPVQVVGKAVFTEVVQSFVIDLKGRNVGCA